MSEHVRQALRDRVRTIEERMNMSAAQRRRWERAGQREASRERALEMIKNGRIRPYGGRGYGNGGRPTKAEVELLNRLGAHDFLPEVVVKTGGAVPAKWYRIDLAHQGLKIAVEHDGSSHGRSRREKDAAKDSFLRSQEWLVLRFQGADFDLMEREVLEAMRLRLVEFTT